MRENISEIHRILEWSSDVNSKAKSKGNSDELKIEILNKSKSNRSGDSDLISPTPIRINEDQYPLVKSRMSELDTEDQRLIDMVEKEINEGLDITDEIINNILNN
jgi:hypothetical protein